MIRLQSQKTKQKENIVPMINVALLLLIFFLMAAVIAPEPPIEVELPEVASGNQGVDLAVYLDQSGALFLQDGASVSGAAVAGESINLFAPAGMNAAEVARALRELGALGATGISLAGTESR